MYKTGNSNDKHNFFKVHAHFLQCAMILSVHNVCKELKGAMNATNKIDSNTVSTTTPDNGAQENQNCKQTQNNLIIQYKIQNQIDVNTHVPTTKSKASTSKVMKAMKAKAKMDVLKSMKKQQKGKT